MIRQASLKDIAQIEEIYHDVIHWMTANHIPNLWNEQNTSWGNLSKNYSIDEFYLYYEEDKVAGCMAVTDVDTTYWPEIKKGDSIYLHKLAVKREFAGKGISTHLIDYLKEIARKRKIPMIRLDCNAERIRLRQVYETQGFTYIGNVINSNGYELALYECAIVT